MAELSLRIVNQGQCCGYYEELTAPSRWSPPQKVASFLPRGTLLSPVCQKAVCAILRHQ